VDPVYGLEMLLRLMIADPGDGVLVVVKMLAMVLRVYKYKWDGCVFSHCEKQSRSEPAVGDSTGLSVGKSVGEPVGDSVGVSVGDSVGESVGDPVGIFVGDSVIDPGTATYSSTFNASTPGPGILLSPKYSLVPIEYHQLEDDPSRNVLAE
jgi:hypothetical protein